MEESSWDPENMEGSKVESSASVWLFCHTQLPPGSFIKSRHRTLGISEKKILLQMENMGAIRIVKSVRNPTLKAPPACELRESRRRRVFRSARDSVCVCAFAGAS